MRVRAIWKPEGPIPASRPPERPMTTKAIRVDMVQKAVVKPTLREPEVTPLKLRPPKGQRDPMRPVARPVPMPKTGAGGICRHGMERTNCAKCNRGRFPAPIKFRR